MENFLHNTKTLLPSKEYNIFQHSPLIMAGRRAHTNTEEGRSHYCSPLMTNSRRTKAANKKNTSVDGIWRWTTASHWIMKVHMKDPTIKCQEYVTESNRKMPRSPQESSQPYMIAEELWYNIHTSVQILSDGRYNRACG